MSVVEQVLERRQARDRAALGRFSTVTSILLHALLVAALILGPRLGRKERPPIKYVSAQIVPLQALGRPEPPPKAPPQKPRAEPPPPPQPQPEVAPPKEETPTPKDPEIPVLPDRKAPAVPPPAPEPEPLPPAPPVRQGSETGNNRGTAAFGAAVAALDNPDFTYSYYIDRMVALIRSRWQRPSAIEGTESAVHFRILKDGTITELELRKPSGDALFDRAALRAVQEASPLPPLPVGYRRDSLGVSLIVR